MSDAIYIASKTKHGERWRHIASVFPVISSWIYESEPYATLDWPGLWRRCMDEVCRSKALVIYREPGEELKGAWCEFGAALSRGIPIHAVGIEEFNIAKADGVTHHRTMKDAVTAALAEPIR